MWFTGKSTGKFTGRSTCVSKRKPVSSNPRIFMLFTQPPLKTFQCMSSHCEELPDRSKVLVRRNKTDHGNCLYLFFFMYLLRTELQHFVFSKIKCRKINFAVRD